jgi:hypothetical protein
VTDERVFTVEEADAELDELRDRLPRLREARDALIASSRRISDAVASDGGGVEGSEWFAHQEALKAEVLFLAHQGILLRDPDIGLVDFPAERDGRRVYLCWKLGEEHVAWYHEATGGFGGRRPL